MIRKTLTATALLIAALAVLGHVRITDGTPQSTLSVREAWSTDRVFRTPESALYDRERDVVYVSNINGDPRAKDGNGFISRLGTNGDVETLEWITGLNAPKGMGALNDKLYVADIDQLVEIAIRDGEILKRYTSDRATFLNDVSIHPSGDVYVSDNVANIVFRLRKAALEPWLDSPELDLPNGLWAEEHRLLVGVNGSVLSVDLEDKTTARYIDNTGFIDGLVAYGNGHYLVSDFSGMVHLVHPQNAKLMLIDTTNQNVGAADIDYVIERQLLLVTTFLDNRVTAYELRTN